MSVIHTVRAGWHFGNAAHSRRVGRFQLLLAHFPARLRTPLHSHETAAFSLVMRGRYAQRFGSREIDYRPPVVVFRPPAVEHTDRISDQGADCFIIEPDAAWLGDMRLGALGDRQASHAVGVRGRWIAHQILAESRIDDSSTELAIEGLVLALAAQFSREHDPPHERAVPAWLQRAREALDASCTSRLTLTTLAEEAGVHPVYLCAAFKRAYGLSIGAYSRTRRLNAARQALGDGDRPIAEIAVTHGFSSQSHFTRVFREHFGLTPLSYRKLLAAG